MTTEGLSVRYGAVQALTDVSFELEPGVVHGVLGPNGAGKSTFIDALSGRRKVSAGEVYYRGSRITGRTVRWRRRQGIGRSFQKTSVFPGLTVREQLELVAWRNDDKDLDGLIDELRLGPLMDRRCASIAYGEQRRVDIGLALVGRPNVLLLDEPGAGLTAQESLDLATHVRSLALSRDVAVLFVEHDVEAVFGSCDRVTVFDLGRVIATGTPQEVRQDRNVIDAYLGRAG